MNPSLRQSAVLLSYHVKVNPTLPQLYHYPNPIPTLPQPYPNPTPTKYIYQVHSVDVS